MVHYAGLGRGQVAMAKEFTNRAGLDRVDHLIYTVPDLETAMDDIENSLGVRPVIGGRHAAYGTCNALLSLGGQTYLEIMAADRALNRPERGRLFGLDTLESQRLATWVLREERIEALKADATTRGLELGELQSGSREKPDGTIVSWKISDPYALRFGGVVPFLIAWGDTPHPSESIPNGGELSGLRIQHPDPFAVTDALNALGVSFPVEKTPHIGLVATIRVPSGEVELR